MDGTTRKHTDFIHGNRLDVSYKAIKAAAPRVNMQVVFLDLGSLHSVREGARKMLDLGEPNILINNAAVVCRHQIGKLLTPTDARAIQSHRGWI